MTSKPPPIEALWKTYEFKPNPNQEKAIRHTDGPLYLPAGPGSGKTRVLLWRTLNLIVYHNVSPDEIYLSTFTKKAAFQLQEGIRSLLATVTNHTDVPYDISRMYVGTMHSLCQRLITDRRFSSNRRRHQQPNLLDELSQYFYLARTARWTHLLSDLDFGGEPDEVNLAINTYFGKRSSSKFQAVNNCLSFFNRLSEEAIDPDVLPKRIRDKNLKDLLAMYKRYLLALKEERAVPQTDFSLLQQEAYRILQAFDGANPVFKHVIIDEYQDTNTIQEKLIFELGKGTENICVVGDDDQALYRFRGATVENFVDFPERCKTVLGREPTEIPLDTNYRSRQKIVTLYSDFMQESDWDRNDGSKGKFRVDKEIKANRGDESPSVVASTPGAPRDVCEEIAELVKKLLDTKTVENENQIAFLFPSLKSDQVARFREALDAVGLKVYAPRAGRFIEVDEAVAVFGVFLHIFGKPAKGEYPGHDYKDYFDWVDLAHTQADDLIKADRNLKQFVRDKKKEIELAVQDHQALLAVLKRKRWQQDQPYDLAKMKRDLIDAAGLSDRARKNISNRYFDRIVETRQQEGRPVRLDYVLARATSLDWNVLDLFYRLCTFDHFKEMFDLAERGEDEGPICNMSLISQYLSRYMDEYRSVITAEVLLDDKFQQLFFGSYLYTLFRMGESEYEDAEDPFPKGRIPFLTIHQAKGLEFPVVVFGNPRKQVRLQPMEQVVQPLLDRQGEPLDRMAQFDFMRLFYVALSRAKNLLIIPHWSSKGNHVSKPLKDMLNDEYVTRIPDFMVKSVPKEKLDNKDLPKNYSFTSDYLLYEKCPRQYMIFRKYGFVPSRSQTMFFGSLVHRTLEDLHQFLIAQRENA